MTDRLKRVALLLGAVLFLATPIVLLTVFVRGSVADEVANRSTKDRVRTAQLAAALLDNQLDDVSGELKDEVTQPGLIAALRAGDVAALRAKTSTLVKARSRYESVLAIGPTGALLASAQSAPITPAPTGSTTPGTTPVTRPDRSQRDYFVGALASDAPFVSEAYLSGARGQPVHIAVSMAVRDAGELVGVLAVTLAPADLVDTLAPVSDVAGRQLLIVDKGHHVVASSDPARIALASVELPQLDRALRGGRGSVTDTIDGQARVLTYTPIARAAWALYVIDDPSVVLEVERDLQQSIGIAASAALLVSLIFAVVFVALFATLARRQEALARSQQAVLAANVELQTANRHKSEFLSSMSHELRTPMNAIIGFSDLLDEQLHERITERQQHYFSNIRQAGEHLLALINDVLDLSKIESGRIELRPEVVDLDQLLEPVLANSRREATERGIRFESSLADRGTVRLDQGRVRQILYNLTSNALKFTPAGGEVALRQCIEGNDLVLKVSDTGIGIPEDRQSRVFGLFERVNEDRSDASGTGLGLALSQRLVEMHGGSIEFTSTGGRGTTFRFRLPNVVVERLHDADPTEKPTEVRNATAAG